jgi:hypothetical protein
MRIRHHPSAQNMAKTQFWATIAMKSEDKRAYGRKIWMLSPDMII